MQPEISSTGKKYYYWLDPDGDKEEIARLKKDKKGVYKAKQYPCEALYYRRDIVLVKPGHLAAQGTVQLEDVEEYVSVGQHEHDVQTVGGLVWAELGRRPQVGDEVVVGGVTLRVEAMDGLSVTQVSLLYPTTRG